MLEEDFFKAVHDLPEFAGFVDRWQLTAFTDIGRVLVEASMYLFICTE